MLKYLCLLLFVTSSANNINSQNFNTLTSKFEEMLDKLSTSRLKTLERFSLQGHQHFNQNFDSHQ